VTRSLVSAGMTRGSPRSRSKELSIQTLGLSLRTKGEEGRPIPTVFKQLADVGAHIRRGQVTLVGSAPGGGKSGLLTKIATESKVPTLYFSADSDKGTFGIRVVSSTLNVMTDVAEELLIEKDEDALAAVDDDTGHMWVNFDSSPSPKDISDETDVFATVYGSYPVLIVVDNLMDVSTPGMLPVEGHDKILDFCKQLARRTEAAVVVLCHVTGQYTDGLERIPRSGLINKIDKRPRLILTLYHVGPTLLGVCVVKNSNGRASSDGSMEVHIPVIWEKGFYGLN